MNLYSLFKKVNTENSGQGKKAGCDIPLAFGEVVSPGGNFPSVETYNHEPPADLKIVNSPVAAPRPAPALSGGAGQGVAGCSQSALVTKWAGFIDGLQEAGGFSWSWFFTLTFKNGDTHPEAGMKAVMRMIHIINRHSYGVRYTKHKGKGIISAIATEYQARGAIHYHGLFGAVPDRIRRMDYVDYWFKNHGIARIFKYEHGRGAEQYLSKNSYAWKKGEIDICGPLEYRITDQVRFAFQNIG